MELQEENKGPIRRIIVSGGDGEIETIKKSLATILQSPHLPESTEPLNLGNHNHG
jgi:hypothetical protein